MNDSSVRSAFEALMRSYVANLSRKKREKALITSDLYDVVIEALLHPFNTRNGSSQDRFWAREHFVLDGDNLVRDAWLGKDLPPITAPAHTLRLVVKEDDAYDRILEVHEAIGHKGRDKTFAKVQKLYARIPKELVVQFLKVCPHPDCQARLKEKNKTSSSRDLTPSSIADVESPTSPSRNCSSDVESAGSPTRHQRRKTRGPSPYSVESILVKRRVPPSACNHDSALRTSLSGNTGYPTPPPSSSAGNMPSRSHSPIEPTSARPPRTFDTRTSTPFYFPPTSPPLPFSLPVPTPAPASYYFLLPRPSETSLRSSASPPCAFSVFSPLEKESVNKAFRSSVRKLRASPSFRGSDTGCEFFFPPPSPSGSSSSSGSSSLSWVEEQEMHCREKASPFKPTSGMGKYATLAPRLGHW
ncbi:hypothetical protein JCM11251_001770 [Rhodosporidiobolus azoricus]